MLKVITQGKVSQLLQPGLAVLNGSEDHRRRKKKKTKQKKKGGAFHPLAGLING